MQMLAKWMQMPGEYQWGLEKRIENLEKRIENLEKRIENL